MKVLPSVPWLAAALSLLVFALPASAEEWYQFRGPTGRGHSEAKDLPVSWDETNVAWKVPLKGQGQSSPVIWGERVFLTGASDDGKERYVMCLAAKDGAMVWEKTIPCPEPEGTHRMNSWATPSCATDGEHVVAFFGPAGLHCFTVEGEEAWSVPWGSYEGPWGVGASPVIVDGLVIQNGDTVGPSRLAAFDLKTGEVAWETERTEKPRGGWSTPILVEFEGRRELVLNGEFGLNGYDPETGKELWFCKAFNGRGTPVPEYADGRIHGVSGQPGDTYCVKPGGSGDVTATHLLWHAPRKGGRDLPSPALVDGYLMVSSMSGIVTSYDAATGEIHFTERLGEGIEIAAAPFVANGLVYFQSVKGGDVIVLRPGKELDIVAINSLGEEAKDEEFRSTIAPHGDQLLIRSGGYLYRIGE